MTTKIHALDGTEPHPSYGGWEKFLASIKLRGEVQGCDWYGSSNCNYFVFTTENVVVENFGYHADNLWRKIQEEGADVCLSRIKKAHEGFQKVSQCIKTKDWEGAKKSLRRIGYRNG